MNIINKLTLRQMKLSKRRTLVTIIGITLAVTMITAVSAGVTSIMGYLGKAVEEKYTRFHVKVADFEYEDREVILGEFDVQNYTIAKVVEDCFMDTTEGDIMLTPYEYIPENVKVAEEENYIGELPKAMRIMAVTEAYYEMMNIELSGGSFPQNDSEILVSENFGGSFFGGLCEVGDKLTIGDREYTVCGLINDNGGWVEGSADYENQRLNLPGTLSSYVAYTVLDINELNNKDIVSGYYYLEKPYSGVEAAAEDVIDVLQEQSDRTTGVINTGGEHVWYSGGVAVEYNYDVMMFYGISEEPLIDIMVVAVKLILFAIIMIGAIVLIANSFIISISERSRYLGMLASVGATSRQRRDSVYFEGFIEGIISIPVGILTGLGGISLIFKAIEPIVKELSGQNFGIELIVDWSVIAWAVVISTLTIFLSAYVPAKRVAGLSAIDAIRQNKDIRVTARDVRNRRITKRILGIEGELALKNLKRNRKRYRVTILSLFISIVLFMSVYGIISFLRCQLIYEADMQGYDIEVSNNERASTEMYAEKLQYAEVFKVTTDDMMDAEYTKDSSRFFDTWNVWHFDAVIMNDESIYNEDYLEAVREAGEFLDKDIIYIIAMTPEDLKRYLDKVDIDYDAFVADECNTILFDGDYVKDNSTLRERYLYIGDKFNESCDTFNIEIRFDLSMISDSYFENGKFVEITHSPEDMEYEFNVYSREEKIIGMSSYPYLLVTPQVAKKILEQDAEAFIQRAYFSTDDDKAHEQIYESVLESYGVDDFDGYHIDNRTDSERGFMNMLTLIEVFVYVFIGLITLICVANIVNTLSTGMALRRSEFAMLKSMGMTQRSFRKMLTLEGIMYGLKALLYGLPTGSLIIFGAKYIFEEYGGFVLEIPWEVYLIVIISVFVVTVITLIGSSGKIKKENIIEGLRNENH